MAIKNICDDNNNEGISIAIWELFFSVEISLKLLYFDIFDKEVKGHKLSKIIQEMPCDIQIKLLAERFIKEFPSSEECIRYRYSEIYERDIKVVFEYYLLALSFIDCITELLKRSLRMFNCSITFRNPYNL